MEYLTYSEYQEFSTTVSSTDFDNLERRARRKLDYFTQDRLKTATVIIDEVKEVMVDFIDKISKRADSGNMISYSNGIESIGLEKNQKVALDEELYQIAIEYLPIELISAYVEEV